MEVQQQKLRRTEKEISKPADFTDPAVLYQKLIDSIREYHPSTDLSLVEKAYHLADDEDTTRKDEQKVVQGQRHQRVGATQESQERYAQAINSNGDDSHEQRSHPESLCDCEVGSPVIIVRQMDACHHRHTHTEHQGYAGGYQEQRSNNVDGGQRIASYALTDENAVGHCVERSKHH